MSIEAPPTGAQSSIGRGHGGAAAPGAGPPLCTGSTVGALVQLETSATSASSAFPRQRCHPAL